MGRIKVKVRVENLLDVLKAQAGELPTAAVRSMDLDALVDTGATMLALPRRAVAELGLPAGEERPVRTAAGVVDTRTYYGARVTVMGRSGNFDATEVPDDCPPLLGQIPLEQLDFVADPVGQRLIGNPEHQGKWVLDVF